MRLTKKSLFGLLILVLILLAGCGGKDDTAAEVAKIEGVWKTYATAVSNEDAELWLSMWDENCTRLAPNFPAMTIEDVHTSVAPAFEYFDDMEMSVNPVEIEILGDRAYSFGTFESSFTPKGGGDPIVDSGKFLTILAKQDDGSWKILVDSFNTSLPAQ